MALFGPRGKHSRRHYTPLQPVSPGLMRMITVSWLQASRDNFLLAQEMAVAVSSGFDSMSPRVQGECGMSAEWVLAQGYGTVRNDSDRIAMDKYRDLVVTAAVFGWTAAYLEQHRGWVRPGLTHPAIHNALCLLRQGLTEDDESSIGYVSLALEMGYAVKRAANKALTN